MKILINSCFFLILKIGIDPSLSARIEREENEANTASAIAASRTVNLRENTGFYLQHILKNNKIFNFREEIQ